MGDMSLANGSLSARHVVARALCAARTLLSCPERAQRDTDLGLARDRQL